MTIALLVLIAITSASVGLAVGIRYGGAPGAHRPRSPHAPHLRDIDHLTPPHGLTAVPHPPRHALTDTREVAA